jgi:hypothetical protein
VTRVAQIGKLPYSKLATVGMIKCKSLNDMGMENLEKNI